MKPENKKLYIVKKSVYGRQQDFDALRGLLSRHFVKVDADIDMVDAVVNTLVQDGEALLMANPSRDILESLIVKRGISSDLFNNALDDFFEFQVRPPRLSNDPALRHF